MPFFTPEELAKMMAAELKCPKCQNYVQPPAGMCTFDHLVCKSCFLNGRCPLCAARESKTTSDAMEGLLTIIAYVTKPCPVRKNNSCTWRGITSDLDDHITDCHAVDILHVSGGGFMNYGVMSRYVLLEFDNQWMRCHWVKDIEEDALKISIQQIEKYDKDYSYEFHILRQDDKKVMTIDGLVKKYSNGSYEQIGYNLALSFADSRGKLKFLIEIKPLFN